MIAASLVTARQDIPDGKTPGNYQVTMSFDGAPDVVQSFSGTSFEFPADAPGVYSFSAVRLDADGVTAISTPVTAKITVPAPAPQFDAPASITLALA